MRWCSRLACQGALALAKSLLDSASIPYLVTNNRWGRLGGGNPAVGAIEIHVRPEDEEAARQILAEIGVARQCILLVARIVIVLLFLLLPLIAAIINALR